MARPLRLVTAILLGSAAMAGCSKPTGPANLTVKVTLDRSSGSYIEGFVPFLQLGHGGTPLVDQRIPSQGGGWVVTKRLDPGTYRVTSYVRPCDANCGNLGQPTDRCSEDVTIVAGSHVEVDVVERPAHGCTMTKSSSTPPR